MGKEEILTLIAEMAARHGCPAAVVSAIVAAESSFNIWAIRYEPHYIFLALPAAHASRLKTTIESEATLQRFSYGLMQIMGGAMREHGYQEPLMKSFDPEVNLHYGCMHFSNFLKRYGKIEDAISSYNQGAPRKDHNRRYLNQAYVDNVINLMQNFSDAG